jgi:hypothetical protein
MIHRDVGIFEMFLASAYHPRNSHCVYIDAKADENVFRAVDGIVKCYKEVFLKVRMEIGVEVGLSQQVLHPGICKLVLI